VVLSYHVRVAEMFNEKYGCVFEAQNLKGEIWLDVIFSGLAWCIYR